MRNGLFVLPMGTANILIAALTVSEIARRGWKCRIIVDTGSYGIAWVGYRGQHATALNHRTANSAGHFFPANTHPGADIPTYDLRWPGWLHPVLTAQHLKSAAGQRRICAAPQNVR
jgi:hypothetical protein